MNAIPKRLALAVVALPGAIYASGILMMADGTCRLVPWCEEQGWLSLIGYAALGACVLAIVGSLYGLYSFIRTNG